jgi:hypothetical protein
MKKRFMNLLLKMIERMASYLLRPVKRLVGKPTTVWEVREFSKLRKRSKRKSLKFRSYRSP